MNAQKPGQEKSVPGEWCMQMHGGMQMREKKDYIVITFHTTTEAMAMEKHCAQYGIPGRLIPVPREITAGCGLAWRMAPEEYAGYRERLQEPGIRFDRTVELRL
jgi:hypothetical protein